MPIDPKITAALADARARQELRDAAVAAALKAGVSITTPNSIPALPPRSVEDVKTTLERLAAQAERQVRNATVQSVPTTSTATNGVITPAPAPVEEPATEAQLGVLISTILPKVLLGVAEARAAFADRKISLVEAASLATTIITVVSTAVKEGAPAVKGQSARALVVAIFGVVFDQFIADLLPTWARPFSGLVRAAAIRGLQAAYDALVKKQAK